jgi:hypothetical protein
MLGNYRVAAQLVASGAVLSSTELVTYPMGENILTYVRNIASCLFFIPIIFFHPSVTKLRFYLRKKFLLL